MPPRKGPGRGIVKSGNAGNSTKPSSSQAPVPATGDTEKEKPLFPPGSKFPLSLLNERCQKNGWEKPEVNTRHHPTGYSFSVTLRRQNKKKTPEVDSVRLEPHPPFIMPTALEARHWGATYALYRVCNNIQLNRVLPPGPRDYWAQLELEHKAAPEHMKWMYSTDPFAARKEVDTRQASTAKRKEEGSKEAGGGGGRGGGSSGAVGQEFVGAVEVKMSGTLRELVENAIKKAHVERSPTAGDPLTSLPVESHPSLADSLKHLSFTPPQITRTLEALSTPSPLTTSLLSSSPNPLEAAISHLLLCVPESDLPPRFLARNSGEAFVQSAYKGTEDLRIRWLLDRAVKEAGYPEPIVRRVVFPTTSHPTGPPPRSWDALLDELGRMLVGDSPRKAYPESNFDTEERDFLRASEIAALESVYSSVTAVSGSSSPNSGDGDVEPTTYLNVPIPNTPLTLHMVLPSQHPYPLSEQSPPMYISASGASTSHSSAPPYVRLHILSTVLGSPIIKDRDLGEGIGLVAAGIIEEEWESIQGHGPPDVADVLKHLLLSSYERPETPPILGSGNAGSADAPFSSAVKKSGKRRGAGRTGDDRSDSQILADFERTKASEKYQVLLKDRMKLPAWKAKDDFLRAFEKNRVVVCVGETGSGKTTQIPQYIFDDYLSAAEKASASGSPSPSLTRLQIVITQPRRVAATSVASRVSAERGDDGSVAYSIRGESNATRRTKLLFCTTGVVLRRLGAGNGLEGVGVIIVDEVHERSVDGDFLLLELRELLKKNRALKVVLMSATINQKTFVDYFGGAALVTIPGRTFPVQDSYLEDIIPLIRYIPPFSKPVQKQTEDQLRAFRQIYEAQGLSVDSVRTLEIVTRADQIDYQLVAATVAYIVGSNGPGAILIFMPGVNEIRQCIDALRSATLGSTVEIFPLHANLSSEEQKVVFKATFKRKIVVATNVAETSITIDDVVYVIDTGKVKETSYDPETGLSRLAETWVTQAAARQRKGRAGRTKPGECYKLYTRKQEQDLGPFPIPEILRVPLESLSLTVKAMREHEDVKLFLGKAIDPPKVSAMERAWSVLQELGAIDEDGNLTALGRHMSLLPVDLRLGKMLVLGSIFDCLDPVLTVAACLSSKPLFFSPMEKREEATKARAQFMSDNSDLLTDAKAYDECMKVLAGGRTQGLRAFCEDNFISYTTVRDITSLREDFSSALSSTGFMSQNSSSSTAKSPHPALLKSILMAGLYPRIARITLPSSAIKFDKVQAGAVQREQEAKAYKIFDLDSGEAGGRGNRVFLHPSSVLFGEAKWKEPFVCYFKKAVTTKPFLRDATEVPLYAVLLFGGPISINHVGGGLTIGGPDKTVRLRLKAWPRIGVLINQLRHLLDTQLAEALETTSLVNFGRNNPVLEAMLALLTKEGFGG